MYLKQFCKVFHSKTAALLRLNEIKNFLCMLLLPQAYATHD